MLKNKLINFKASQLFYEKLSELAARKSISKTDCIVQLVEKDFEGKSLENYAEKITKETRLACAEILKDVAEVKKSILSQTDIDSRLHEVELDCKEVVSALLELAESNKKLSNEVKEVQKFLKDLVETAGE